MENKAGNSSRIKSRSNKKCSEENGDSLWSLFDVRLPALCQKLLTENQSKYPHVTGHGRSKQNTLDSRPKKPRRIMVKSAKCQADLITHFQVPKEVDTALAKVSRPKRRRKSIQMETLPSERNVCSDPKTSDIHLPDLDFNENGAGIKQLDTLKNGIGSGMKGDDREDNVGLMEREEKKFGTGKIKDKEEKEVPETEVDRTGANGCIAAQFRGLAPREGTIDTRNSTAETSCQNKQSEKEYPQEQNITVDTSQISETQCLKVHNNSISDTNEISEPECLKEQTIITVHTNQIPVRGPELSEEWKNTVQMNKISKYHIPDYKKHNSITERKCAEVHGNEKHNSVSETEPTKTLSTCTNFSMNRDKPINEPNRNNKSEIGSTEELDTSINYNNTATNTHTSNASEMECREAQDTIINDKSIGRQDKNNLSETVCTEELDNAANERIIKAGCKEEQDNIANDVKNTSETTLTEQQNNVAHYNNSVSETHKNIANEMYNDNMTHRNDMSETEFTEKLDNTSKNSKIELRDSGEMAYLTECDMHTCFFKLKLDKTKETSDTLKQSQNVKINEKCSATEETTSPVLKLDELRTRELAKQTEISESHKPQEDETNVTACNASRKHNGQQYDKSQQHECRTREKNDKTETEFEAQNEQEASESECSLEHNISQLEHRRESEPKTGQIECRKQNDISHPEYREDVCDISQPTYTKEPELNTGQTACRKQYDISHPEYREDMCDIRQPTYTKEPELNTGQIECRKQDDKSQLNHRKELDQKRECIKELDVGRPKYEKEHKMFHPECIKEVKNNYEYIDNDWKLVIKANFETDETQNNAGATRNYHEQNTICETTDFEEATSGEQESKIESSEAKNDQENIKEIIKWKNRKTATNNAKIEKHIDTLKTDDISTCSESYHQTTLHPKLALTDYRPESIDHRDTDKPELYDLECQEVSIKLPTRNENDIHQVVEKCNTGTHLLAFEVDTQAITIEETDPLCSVLAKTVAVSDFMREANHTQTNDSANNNDSTSSVGNKILVLLPPVSNTGTKKLIHGISGMCNHYPDVPAVASNCTKTSPKESCRAFVQMISRQVSAYILDRKTNTARIVPLDSSINNTVEQEDSGSAVFSEDIQFQNGRLLCWNSEARPRRVSSTDCRYFQSNPIEKLHSGSSRRSRSESLTRRRALNKEWEVVTKTTREELIIFSQPQPSGRTIRETASSQESCPKCSVNINSSKFQNSQASPVQQVVHLQPFCPSISADKKSDGNNKPTELQFSQSQICQELSENNLTSMEKPICCSRGTKTGNDVPGSSAVQKSPTELASGAKQERIKELTGNSLLENLETQMSLGKSSCSSFYMNTRKLTTETHQQCDDPNMISWRKTNKNPWQLHVLPEICTKTNHEEYPFSSKEEHCFKTDAEMSEFCGCDTEVFADLNSKQSGSTKTERGYHSKETELSVANNGSSETAANTKLLKSHLTGNIETSFGGKMESFSHADTPVSSDFAEVTELTNIKTKDAVIQCKAYESREVFTQTETNNFTQQSQLIATQHDAHSTSDLPWHPDTQNTKFEDGNFTSVDNIRLPQSAYPRAYSKKYIQDERTRNKAEKLDFIPRYMTNNSTLTDCTEALQNEISFGGLIAKELAGYIFYTDKRNSMMPCRTNIKRAIKRSSSLSDVQTDLQKTLVISEKLRTLLDTGQTVLVFQLPQSDNC